MLDNPALIRKSFEQPRWYLQGTRYNIQIRAETVKKFLHGAAIGRILDIGCGDASLSLPLLNGHNCLMLVDQSQAMLDIARSRVPAGSEEQVSFLQGSFMEAEFDSASFDVILCIGVLAYIRRELRRDFIAKVRALLKPGGRLILECTNLNHLVTWISLAYHKARFFIRPQQMRTIVGPSSEVLAIASDLGLDLGGSYRYCLPPPVLRNILPQRLSYTAIHTVFGLPGHNRAAWLGNECIYHLRAPGP